MEMLLNLWEKVKFYCCCHKEPQLMYEHMSKTPVYLCRQSQKKDDQNPYGHAEKEPPCMNRLNFYIAASLLEKISKMIEEEMDDGFIGDYRNLSFVFKGMKIRILDFSDRILKIGLERITEAPKWKNTLL